MKKFDIFIILVVYGMLFGCATTKQKMMESQDGAPLIGMIYDYDNNSVASTKILLNDKEVTSSDINGRFSLGVLEYGSYTIKVNKVGYEAISLAVDFLSSSQILYIKLISSDQLVGLAEREVEKRDWRNAIRYLDRCDKIGTNPVARYLRAVILFRQKDIDASVRILEGLLVEGYDYPFVHFFLADLQQYYLKDDIAAYEHLKSYLRMRSDPDIEKRMKSLVKNEK